MKQSSSKAPWRAAAATLALLAIGTFVFPIYEHGMSTSESFYQTVLLLLSHFDHYGFKSSGAKTLVVLLITASYIVIAYLLKWAAEYIVGVGISVKKQRMRAKVAKLKNHYIVCGLGRVGSQVAREMNIEKESFVGLDKDPEKVNEASEAGFLAFEGDSTQEEFLREAGVEHAAGLVACLGEDSHNLLVVLTARSINPDLYIVGRCNRAENEIKLKRAGADRVALPYQIGGYHMAAMALRPSVVDYIDIVNKSEGASDLQVEEMEVMKGSRLAGKRLGVTLADHQIKGATVIAINGADGANKIRPSGNEVIYPGDRLFVLGSRTDLNSASELVSA